MISTPIFNLEMSTFFLYLFRTMMNHPNRLILFLTACHQNFFNFSFQFGIQCQLDNIIASKMSYNPTMHFIIFFQEILA